METKKWYESRTIRFAILTGALGIITAFTSTYPEGQYTGFLITLSSLLNVALRLDTTKSVE